MLYFKERAERGNFMKELVEPLYISYLQALDPPQNLFPFPRTGHLKLLKPIFHTNQWHLTAVARDVALCSGKPFVER